MVTGRSGVALGGGGDHGRLGRAVGVEQPAARPPPAARRVPAGTPRRRGSAAGPSAGRRSAWPAASARSKSTVTPRSVRTAAEVAAAAASARAVPTTSAAPAANASQTSSTEASNASEKPWNTRSCGVDAEQLAPRPGRGGRRCRCSTITPFGRPGRAGRVDDVGQVGRRHLDARRPGRPASVARPRRDVERRVPGEAGVAVGEVGRVTTRAAARQSARMPATRSAGVVGVEGDVSGPGFEDAEQADVGLGRPLERGGRRRPPGPTPAARRRRAKRLAWPSSSA